MEGDGIKLSGICRASSADVKKCIICQADSSVTTTSTANRRKRIYEAASVRDDVVAKRLKCLGDNEFVYHMSNSCYKQYTLQKALGKIRNDRVASSELREEDTDPSAVHSNRARCIPRPGPSQICEKYQQSCVVCGHAKHQGLYAKYRICELNRAQKFLEATTFLQDQVYTRDLQDVETVFGADLYCHKLCIRNYTKLYERTVTDRPVGQPTNAKLTAWSHVIADIETGLHEGEGYELTYTNGV